MQTALSLSTVTATQEQVDALLRALLPAQGQWAVQQRPRWCWRPLASSWIRCVTQSNPLTL